VDHDGFALTSDISGAGSDRILSVRLAGAIDMDACAKLTDELVGTIRLTDAPRVVIDLGETDFIDSHCVGMLVAGFDAARLSGRGFALARARGVVRRVLEVSGLATLLKRD